MASAKISDSQADTSIIALGLNQLFVANMTNNTSLNSITFLIVLGMICISLGCEQSRYTPSAWAPATGSNGTLPGVGLLDDGSVGVNTSAGSLPFRNDSLPSRDNARTLPGRGSLPWRAGNQGSLPNRLDTLPGRQQIVAQRPKKKVKPPLPSLDGKPVWDVREKREMPRVPGRLGLYMGDDKGIIKLPSNNFQRGSGSTLPSRSGVNTLPARGPRTNWSTLPGRK